MLNKTFKKLDLNDYLCSYTDHSEVCKYQKPSDTQIDAIFREMGKNTKAE